MTEIESPSFVYMLVSTDNKSTYIGATKNLERRLRQHNKEIKGGAHATGIKVATGQQWTRCCYVSGFPTWQSALQFEWRWKQLSRKYQKMNIDPIQKRMLALDELTQLEKSTENAIPYSEWITPLKIHYPEEENVNK